MMLVPKEPNEEQRQEVAEAKSDNDAGTIKTGLAAICAVVAFACSVVGIWAAATEHYSTLITVVVGGMISFAVARWLGWQPKQIRRTTDLLNKLSTLLLTSQSPPPEGYSVPPDEQSKAEQFEAQHDIVAKELVRTKLELERVLNEKEQRRLDTTELQHNDSVDETPTEKLTEEPPEPARNKFSSINAGDGMERSIPFNARWPPSDLDEVEEQLLMALWIEREVAPTCAEHKLVSRIRHLLDKLNKPPLYKAELDYHLIKLARLGYVEVSRERDWTEYYYFLTYEGTAYVKEHKLLDADWYGEYLNGL